jgi:hypothetical protein
MNVGGRHNVRGEGHASDHIMNAGGRHNVWGEGDVGAQFLYRGDVGLG